MVDRVVVSRGVSAQVLGVLRPLGSLSPTPAHTSKGKSAIKTDPQFGQSRKMHTARATGGQALQNCFVPLPLSPSPTCHSWTRNKQLWALAGERTVHLLGTQVGKQDFHFNKKAAPQHTLSASPSLAAAARASCTARAQWGILSGTYMSPAPAPQWPSREPPSRWEAGPRVSIGSCCFWL